MGKKRIIQLPGTTTIVSTDYLGIDSNADGARKISFADLQTAVLGGMDLSKISDDIAPQYDSTESYVAGDIVIYQDVLYICTGATTGTWNSAKWDSTSIADLLQNIDLSAEAISYDNTTSGLEATDVQGAIDEIDGTVDEAVSDISALEADVAKKAYQEGVYDKLTVGLSKNVISNNYTTDNAPYLYRQSPSASAVDLSIVGGTIAWNQLVVNGNFESGAGWTAQGCSITLSGNNVATVNFTDSGGGYQLVRRINLIEGHKFYSCIDVNVPNTTNTILYTGGALSGAIRFNGVTGWQRKGFVFGGSVYDYLIIRNESGGAVDGVQLRNVMTIDLTQAFGSTIADYVYSLEQSTAGSGIAWLKSYGYLTKDYYAYQPGKLESVNVASRKIVGKNLLAKSFAYVNSVSSTLANMFFIKKGTYIFHFDDINATSWRLGVYLKDSSGNNLSDAEHRPSSALNWSSVSNWWVQGSNGTSKTMQLTIVEDCYIRILFGIGDTSSSTVTTGAQLEFGSSASQYELYTSTTYDLDSSKILRGIPKLSNGQMYYDGDVMSSDGTVTRKYGVVDLGTLNWTKNESSLIGVPCFYTNTITNYKPGSPNIKTTKYITKTTRNDIDGDKQIAVGNNSDALYVVVRDDSYSDATTFKTAMNGVYLVYELSNSVEETSEPFTNPQLVGSTEEYIDASVEAGTRDVAIPCGGNNKYHFDLKSKVEQLYGIPEVPSTNGDYTLKATRSSSGVTYTWQSQ